MFHSFFPNPRLYFTSFAAFALASVLVWFFWAIDLGDSLSLGTLFNFGYPQQIADGADESVKLLFAAQKTSADSFWFYQYFLASIVAFCGFWMWYSPHPWQKWSVLGSALIFFTNWFLVQLDVMINKWFGEFYDLIQKALGNPGAVTEAEYFLQIGTFLKIAFVYVGVVVLFRFFVSHYVFRWRTSMNDYYLSHWDRLRHIEGASQRIQEDAKEFAKITETLGVNLLDSLMVLVAFLPLLWGLSAQVTSLPIVGEVSQGLVFVAIIWSIIGTALLAIVGVKLPGLQFQNQMVEAAFRKELVHGEDDQKRADPPTVTELFSHVRKNYFRLYFHYMYFNIARFFYLQFGNLVPYIALGPTIVSGVITLGVMQQIVRAFGKVESSFQYLVHSWTTIVELISIYKRLKAFELVLNDKGLSDFELENIASTRRTPGE